MPIDWTQYDPPAPTPVVPLATTPPIAPAPTPAPVPSATAPINWNQYDAPAPAAPQPFVLPKHLGGPDPLAKPAVGRRLVDSLMTPDAPVAQAPRDPQSIPPSLDVLKAEWDSLQSEIAANAGSPVSYAGAPKTFAEYAATRLIPFDQTRPTDVTIPQSRGVLGAFGADLSSGMSRLGSMWKRGQLAPDIGLEQEIAQTEAGFAPRTFAEKVAGGVGGSLPAVVAVAASRGRTLPVATGSMAVPLEVAGSSFVQGMAQPGRTPEQNISGSLIEALTTRAGGALEPGFAGALSPRKLGTEYAEERAAGTLGDISDQINDPEAIATGAPIDWERANEAGSVSGAAGVATSGILSPMALAQRRAPQQPVTPEPSQAAEPVPTPEQEAAAEAEERAKSEREFDEATTTEEDAEAPHVATPAEKEVAAIQQYLIDHDETISEDVAYALEERLEKLDAVLQEESRVARDARRAERRTPELAPEVEPETVPAAPDLQDVTQTQVIPERAAAQYDARQAQSQEVGDAIVPPAPVAKAPPKPLAPAVPVAAKPRDIQVRPEPKEAFDVEPVAQSTLNFEGDTDAGMATPSARGDRIAQEPIPTATPTAKRPAIQAPAKAPVASFPKKQIRGSLKGQFEARKRLGPAGIAPKIEVPPGTERVGVNAFKDAGQHPMDVKMVGKYGIAIDPDRAKVLVVTRTDEKGRPDENGSQFRPVDADGKPSVLSDDSQVHVFDNIKDAARFAARNFSVTAPKGEVVGFATDAEGKTARVQDAAIEDKEPDLDAVDDADAEDRARRDELLGRIDDGEELTDEELNEADAIEARIKARQEQEPQKSEVAPGAKKPSALQPVGNSPLTPKTRAEIADSIEDDMPAEAVGKLVENLLAAQLKRPPTPQEWSAAVKDIRKNGLIPDSQSVTRGQDVGANQFFTPLVNAMAKIAGVSPGGYLRARFQDLSPDNQAISELSGAVKPGQFGYNGYQIAKFISNTIPGLRGRAGAWLVDVSSKLGHLLTARTVAAMHPEFRPVLRLAQEQIDRTRLSYQEYYERLSSFRNLPPKSYERVNGALIQFRLEDRQPKDFDKPLDYDDERGVRQSYTLTPREIMTVKEVYATNKAALKEYVDVLRQVFGLPATIKTSADLAKAISAGQIPVTAKILEGPMKVLESGVDNYVPLKRYGDKYHAVIYDAAKFNAAKTEAQRKAAELGFIKAESNADLNRQIENAGHKFPGSYTLAYEDREPVSTKAAPVTAAQLAELAEVAGVPPVILQDFLDAGVESYLETRGIGARFAKAEKVPGFSHDMLRGVASHLQAMTQATERLRHRHLMEKSTKLIKDVELKRYSTRFIERIDTPVSQVAQGVRQITTLYYLGLGLVSAFVNSTTSLFTQPALVMAMTRNPLDAAKAFGQALREQYNALTRILSLGINSTRLGRDMNQIEQAASRYDKSDPKLASAIREAEKAGVFSNVFEREAEAVAKRGEVGTVSKIRDAVSSAMMYFFAKVETANRLAGFIAAHQVHTKNSGNRRYDDFADNLGFSRGGSSAEFAEFFSDFNNFRMDKTDMPSWAQGSFKKNAQGKEVFTPSGWRPMAYALKGWAVNFLQQQTMILRAAVKGGFIDKSLYAALMLGFLTTFGSVNMVPGLQTLDALDKKFSGDLKSTSEELKSEGGLSRVFTTGWPGMAAESLFGQQVGENIDMLASRAGAGNVIPSSVNPMEIFAPLSVADGQIRGIGNLMSGDAEKSLEGAGQILGKEATRLARMKNQLTGTRGYTTKSGSTLVPSEETAVKGAPFLSTGDIINSALGGQPPVVRDAYRQQQMVRDMKTSNDAVMENAVTSVVDALYRKDKAAVKAAVETVKEWNRKAMDNKEPWKIISGDAFEQAVILEVQARSLGARNLRPVPKGGRARYLQEFEDETPEENIKKSSETETE